MTHRGTPARLAIGGCALLVLAAGIALRSRQPGGPARGLAATLTRVVDRQERSVREVSGLAARLANDPDAARTLGGDNEARIRLFARFAEERRRSALKAAMALVDGAGAVRAWAGPISEPRERHSHLGKPDLFIREGAISTVLVASRPTAGGGTILVEAPVRIRRNIANEYLRDFDAWVGDDVGAEIAYTDVDDAAAGRQASLAPLAPDVPGVERVLRGPSGNPLAHLRVTRATHSLAPLPTPAWRLGLAGCLAVLAALFIASWPLSSPWAPWTWAGAVLAVRFAWEAMLPATGQGLTSFLSSDLYATGWPGLERWLESPLELLVAALVLVLVALGVARAVGEAVEDRSLARFALACVAVAASTGPLFAAVADIADNTNADLTRFAAVLPAAVRSVQFSLLVVMAAALIVAVGVLHRFAWPRGAWRRVACAALWLVIGVAGCALWWQRSEVPPEASMAFYVAAGALALTRGAVLLWPERHRDSRRVVAFLFVVLAAVCCLQPALVFFSERHTRALIQSAYAPFVVEQPLLRRSVLDDARRTVDRLDVLDPRTDPGLLPPLDQLAFAIWSRSELSTFGLSSAVEVRDAAGRVASRFALDLPSLAEQQGAPAEGEAWRVRREVLPLGSVEQPVLHASRSVRIAGMDGGAIHLYVSEDYWNLAFLTPRDPYSLLYRPASLPAARRGPPLNLFVFDHGGRPSFFSAERPPVALRSLGRGLPTPATGFWTRLDLDGQPADAFIFGDRERIHVLSYPSMGIGRAVADLLDAATTALAVAAAALLVLLVARTVLHRDTFSLATLARRVRGRFAWRLLAAFVLLGVVPVGVLQIVARGFVSERLSRAAENQALQRAHVSQKAVEDYASLQGAEGAPAPITDDALTYVASLLRSDLAVFARGSLLAASKRELYSSGLLPSQIDATAFRRVALEGRPYAFGDEEIGGFSYRVLSLPVRLGASGQGVLSLPLTFQGGVNPVVDDLNRSIRLASILFLLTGAALAYFMAWRISGPVSDLTRAARQIAAGDLRARVKARTHDEIASLIEAFNRMAADLDRQRADLERSNRRAAWADMARQVAHEVKNPLTPIRLSAEHLRRVYKEKPGDFAEALAGCTDTILRQVERLRGIAAEFSAFARPAAIERTLLDPGILVREALEPYGVAAPPGVRLELLVGTGLPAVAVEKRLIERALLNLVENAFQAVGDEGSIRVRVSAPVRDVEIDVIDSGPALDAALRARLFEPFFSTKTGGTGLGLLLSRKIAEDHGGGVDLASGDGEPTCIRLRLPPARPAPDPVASSPPGARQDRDG